MSEPGRIAAALADITLELLRRFHDLLVRLGLPFRECARALAVSHSFKADYRRPPS